MEVLLLFLLIASAHGYPDFFTFGDTDEDNDTFGPADWDLVRCRNVNDCVSSMCLFAAKGHS